MNWCTKCFPFHYIQKLLCLKYTHHVWISPSVRCICEVTCFLTVFAGLIHFWLMPLLCPAFSADPVHVSHISHACVIVDLDYVHWNINAIRRRYAMLLKKYIDGFIKKMLSHNTWILAALLLTVCELEILKFNALVLWPLIHASLPPGMCEKCTLKY